MLNHPTFDQLHALRLSGMSHALVEQRQTPDLTALSFEERLGCWWTARGPSARPVVSPPTYARPNSGRAPVSRTSTFGSRAGWRRA